MLAHYSSGMNPLLRLALSLILKSILLSEQIFYRLIIFSTYGIVVLINRRYSKEKL